MTYHETEDGFYSPGERRNQREKAQILLETVKKIHKTKKIKFIKVKHNTWIEKSTQQKLTQCPEKN